MMTQRGVETGFRISRPGLALQFSNVFSIDGAVVHGRALNFRDFAAARGTYLRWRDCKICSGIARLPSSSSKSSFFDVVHDGLRQAQLPGGSRVFDLVSLLDRAQCRATTAIFEHN